MACSSCGGGSKTIKPSVSVKYTAPASNAMPAVVVPRSTSAEKVKLRYYGGGMTKKVSSGCSSCHGGKNSYSVLTTETIMFVSDDAPNGIFRQTFSVGHNYYVTRAQADYLLKLTFRDVAGREQPKFREIKD